MSWCWASGAAAGWWRRLRARGDGWAAAPARAATSTIDGTPLNIFVDDAGRLQVAFDGAAPASLPPRRWRRRTLGSTSPPAGEQPDHPVRGLRLRWQHAIHRGRHPNPHGRWERRQPVGADGGLLGHEPDGPDVLRHRDRELHQRLDGRHCGGTGWTASRPTTACRSARRVYEAANLTVAGNDAGLGVFDPGPPRQVGGSTRTWWDGATHRGDVVGSFQESPSDQIFAVVANIDQTARASTTR
jgi:hypothetical protein